MLIIIIIIIVVVVVVVIITIITIDFTKSKFYRSACIQDKRTKLCREVEIQMHSIHYGGKLYACS